MKQIIYLTAILALLLGACKKNESGKEIDPEVIKPLITSIQPKDPIPGDLVTITGSGFGTVAADVKVAIGTQVMALLSVKPNEITFRLPEGVTEAALTLAIKELIASNTDPQGANIKPKPVTAATPTFTALSPSSGKAGDIVTLTGTNFSTVLQENIVQFTGALSGAPVNAVVKTATSTTITVEVPSGAVTGLVNISVKNTFATLIAGFNGTFTINSSGIGNGKGTLALIEEIKANAYAMATDDDGNIYLTSTSSGENLMKISPAGKILKTYANTEYKTTGHVAGLCNDKNGVVWLIHGNSRSTAKIYKIVRGNDKPVFVRDVNADLIGYNQYSSLSIPLTDMAVDSEANVFYVDNQYDLYKIDANGVQTKYFESDELPVNKTKRVNISDISIDRNDNIYVGGGNQFYNLATLYKISPEKVVTELVYNDSHGYADGVLAQAKFERIYNVEVNADGTELYIGDVNYLRKVNLSTLQVTTAAGTGKAPSLVTVNGQIKVNGEGPALEVTTAPSRLSLSEKTSTLYIKHLNDSLLQSFKY